MQVIFYMMIKNHITSLSSFFQSIVEELSWIWFNVIFQQLIDRNKKDHKRCYVQLNKMKNLLQEQMREDIH